MRNKIFISHATPDDNEFTRWLSLQLIGLGYEVWCDVLRLKGGEDFWIEIESEIRNKSAKFLYILSGVSNYRDGTLKELTVAQKTKKSLNPQDPHFIIPLHIDKNLSYDEINIDLVRLNSINFKNSWHYGLVQLLDKLKEDNVPKNDNGNYDLVNNLWQNIYLYGRNPVDKTELYSSNWFPVNELPAVLCFHKFSDLVPLKFPMWKCKYPSRKYKEYFATFAGAYDFMEELPKTEKYNPQNSIHIQVDDILKGHYDTNFLSNKDARNIVVYLLNLSFKNYLKKMGLRGFKMASKRIAYCFQKDTLEKNKIKGVLMVGKMKYGKDKKINWHFGISGTAKIDAGMYYIVKSHILFTWDGQKFIDKDAVQRSGRRKQGKNWWNRHWREKLLNFISFFANENANIAIQVGEQEYVYISSIPLIFRSPLTYCDPSDDNLPEYYESEDTTEEGEHDTEPIEIEIEDE